MAGDSDRIVHTSAARGTASTPPGDTKLHPDPVSVSGRIGKGKGRPWSESERLLLKDWASRVTAAQHAHYFLMTRLRRRNLWLGIPAVVLSSIVGTALFATVLSANNDVPRALRLAAGFISVLAAVLAGVQTFLKFSERAEKHALAADWLAAVRRDIDLLQATPETERGADPRQTLSDLRKEINKISQNAPAIGERLWHGFAAKYNVREPLDG